MITVRRILLAGVAAAAVALAIPALSSATTFCVNAPTCPRAGIDEGGNLQQALNDAFAAGTADTVLLGSGDGPYTGPFTYQGLTEAGNTVDIRGAGPNRPVLTAPAGKTVLSGFASVHGVDVHLQSASSGIGISALGGVGIGDVHVSGPGEFDGAGATGIQLVGDATLDGVSITGTGEFGVDSENGTVTVKNTRVDNVRFGAGGGAGTLTISGSHIRAGEIALSSRTSELVSRSVLETTRPDSFGVFGTSGALTLDHVTVVHRGPVDGKDAALDFETVDTEPGTHATISSVVAAGYTRGLRRADPDSGTYPLSIRDSVWDSSKDIRGPDALGPITESNDAHVAPALVDLTGGDFRLRGGSAAVDRDTRTDLRYTDIDGVGLIDGDGDGNPLADAGAFEYRRRAPSIDAVQVPDSATAGTPAAFSVVGNDADGDHLKAVWTFGDGAVATGAQVTHTYSAAGVEQVTVTVTDDAGLSVTRTFTVAVGAPAGGSTGTTSSGGATGSTGTGSTGTAGGGTTADRVAPKLTGLRLAPNPVRIGQAKRLRLRFALSERASVRIVARRLKSGRLVTLRGAIVKRLAAGRQSLALAAGLKRLGALRPGRSVLTITATDAAGNHSAKRTVALTVRR